MKEKSHQVTASHGDQLFVVTDCRTAGMGVWHANNLTSAQPVAHAHHRPIDRRWAWAVGMANGRLITSPLSLVLRSQVCTTSRLKLNTNEKYGRNNIYVWYGIAIYDCER